MAWNKYLTKEPKVGNYAIRFFGSCTFLGLLTGLIDNFHDTQHINTEIWWYLVYTIIGLLFLFINHFVLSHIYTKSDNQEQEKREELERHFTQKEEKLVKEYHEKLNEFSKKTTKPNNIIYRRFENFAERSNMIYGFVEYKPFFYKEDLDPKGIGNELLKEIFSPFQNFKLESFNYPTNQNGNNWENVFIDLCNKSFDVIMTPLFETRSRIYSFNISFCIPLFYSNIGVYVRKNSFGNSNKMSFKETRYFLETKIKNNGWKAEFIDGEISASLIKKYELFENNEKESSTPIYPASDEDFAKALQNVSADGGNRGDFIFMEVFKANSIMNKYPNKFKLVNILKDNQLLYPVSFVIRKEETVLKNFINLRIMELRKSGKLEEIIKNEALKVEIKEDEFQEIFIQKYNFNQI